MFHESTAALMHAVDKLINQLRDRTEGTVVKLNDKLTDVFSVCWEQGRTSLDPARQQLVRSARDRAVHRTVPLLARRDAILAKAGLARAQPDVEIADVQGPQERFEAAVAAGNVIDLDEVHTTAPAAVDIRDFFAAKAESAGAGQKRKHE